jgi:hypothetical protein
MFEPSLTIGLVPRIASRVVATHNEPSTTNQLRLIELLLR